MRTGDQVTTCVLRGDILRSGAIDSRLSVSRHTSDEGATTEVQRRPSWREKSYGQDRNLEDERDDKYTGLAPF